MIFNLNSFLYLFYKLKLISYLFIIKSLSLFKFNIFKKFITFSIREKNFMKILNNSIKNKKKKKYIYIVNNIENIIFSKFKN